MISKKLFSVKPISPQWWPQSLQPAQPLWGAQPMPWPACALGLCDQPSKGGRSPSTNHCSLASLQILNGDSCPVSSPCAGLPSIYAQAEPTESSLDMETLVPCSVLPLLSEHHFCCHHFWAIRMRGMRSSCGITLPISHVQGTVMPSWPDEGSLDSAELQSPKFRLMSTRVIPLFSFLKDLVTHFLFLFYFLFHLRFSLVTFQDSLTVSVFCRTWSYFYRLWITFYFFF